eukprot:COSAG04_NODE_5893_length_1463_cov_1.145161_2_plen_77_part_01
MERLWRQDGPKRRRTSRSSQPVEPPATPTTFAQRHGKTELGQAILALGPANQSGKLRPTLAAAGMSQAGSVDAWRQR